MGEVNAETHDLPKPLEQLAGERRPKQRLEEHCGR